MESEAVLDFKTHCIRLESGKVLERRTAAQRVYELLERQDVQASLDDGSGDLTWDRLLARVRKFVLKEAEPSTSKGRGSVSGRSSTAKRYDAVKLFKQVVRMADRNGPRLNCKDVFHHVLTIFREDNLCAAFGPDYASVLLRDLLPVRRYHCEITMAMWCELLKRVTEFLSEHSSRFDRVVLARLLSLIVEHACVQCGHNLNIIQIVVPFFEETLRSATKHVAILGDVIAAFNTLAVTSSVNIRGYLCRLGENVWAEMLQLLKKSIPALRDQLLRFLLIQLRTHHPQGCFGEDSGGWAANERLWRKNLASLYAWLLCELENDNRRLKKKDSGQKPLFIILFVDVFHQVFIYEREVGSQATLSGTPANWSSLRDLMSVNAVPWLQIVVTLLETYPESMPDDEVLPTLEHLHQLQTDIKKLEPMLWTVRCLTALVPVASKATAKSSVWKKVWSSAWRSVSVHHAEDQCFHLLTAIVQNKLMDPDYEPWQMFCAEGGCSPSPCAVGFLAAFLQRYDLPDDLQLRRGFSSLPNVRSGDALEPGTAEDVQASYPLRFRLVQWLLSGFGGGCGAGGALAGGVQQQGGVLSATFAPSGIAAAAASSAKTDGKRASPQVLATVLVALTHRAPSSCIALWNLLIKSSVKSKRLSVLEDDSSSTAESLELFLADQARIELNHLQSTFDKAPFSVVKDHVDDSAYQKCDGAFLPSLQVYLCTVLVQMCGSSPTVSDVEIGVVGSRERLNTLASRLERECRLISLSVHMVCQLLLSSSMTVDDIRDAPLLVHLTALSENVAQGLNDTSLLEVDGETRGRFALRILSCLQPAFACLNALPGLPTCDMPLIIGMCQLFQDGLHMDSLLQQLFRISTCQWPQSRGLSAEAARTPLGKKSGGAKPSSPRVSRTLVSMDTSFDEDDHFDMEETTSTVSMASEASRTSAPTKESYVLHPSLLSSQARLAVLATRLLCNWACACFLATKFGRRLANASGRLSLSGASPIDDESMMVENPTCRHLFAWLSRQDVDYSVAWDIQQTIVIIREFVASSVQLSSEIICSFLEGLRNTMSLYRRDQCVSAEVIRLLTLIVPHLRLLDPGEPLGKDHKLTLHLLAAFWGLYEDTLLSSVAKLELVGFVEALLKADPELKWAEIKIKTRSGEQRSSIRLDAAVCRLLRDDDHTVRMYTIAVVPRLFLLPASPPAWPRLALSSSSAGGGGGGGGGGAQKKRQQREQPRHSAWDTCLAVVGKEQQQAAFRMVEESLRAVSQLETLQDLPDALYEDEGVNRVCSTLAAAGQVAVCSALCEKQALIYIFRSSTGDEEAVPCKVLGLIAQQRGYDSASHYLEQHTEYLLHHWQRDNPRLDDFPYKLYSLPSLADFYRRYSSEVALHLLVRCDEDELSRFAHMLGTEWPELVERNIGRFTVLTLPRFAAEATDGAAADLDEQSDAATRADAFLRDRLSKETVDRLFTRQIDEFVVQLLLHVHVSPGQPGDYSAFASSSDAAPNPPVYTVVQAKATLSYMSQFHQAEQPSLLACLSRWRDCIQRILLALQLEMHRARHPGQRRRYFLLYAIFVEIVFKQAATKLAPARVYLLRDIVHTAVHLLQQTPAFAAGASAASSSPTSTQRCQLHLVGACCHLLTVVCRLAVTSSGEELSKHLSLIVASLLPHANPATTAGKKALGLLDFLIRTSASSRLSESVAKLDPLPDNHEFQRMREAQQDVVDGLTVTLVSELKRFLSAGVDNKSHSRLDGLRHLRLMLQQEHDQLKWLVSRHPALTGHLSDGTETLAMHLISELKRLCEVAKSPPCAADDASDRPSSAARQKQSFSSMQIEVARCLGELATPDLLTVAMVNHTDNKVQFCEQFKDSCSDYCTVVVLHRLSQLLVDPNVDIVSAASESLKAVLATAAGRSFVATYGTTLEDLVPYLDPFLPGRKQKIYEPSSSQQSSSCPSEIDNNELWVPWPYSPATSHAQWICGLSSTLIQHGGIVDDILLCLRPVCQAKVEMAEAMFPFLVHHMLQQGDSHYTVVSRLARQFFTHCSNSFASPNSSASNSAAASSTGHSMSYVVRSTQAATSTSTSTSTTSATAGSGADTSTANLPPAQSMKTMLEMLAFLRQQGRQARTSSRHAALPTVWDNNFWLDLDFFDVAATAQACKAPFTALLYIQIGCDAQRRNGYRAKSGVGGAGGASQADTVAVDGGSGGMSGAGKGDLYSVPMSSFLPAAHRSLLLEAYTSIGEMDSLYGVGADLLGNVQTRLCTYVQEGEWHKAIGTYNMQVMESGHTTYTTAGLLECMQQLGLEHISSVYFDGLLARHPEEAAQVAEYQYQAAWRSMQWDLPQSSRQNLTSGFHQSLYSCLQWLRSAELSSVDTAISEMRVSVVDQLCLACLESTHGVYPILSRLQSLVEVEEVTDVLRGHLSVQLLSERWQSRSSLMNDDFSTIEPVLALRSALLHVVSEQQQPSFNQSVSVAGSSGYQARTPAGVTSNRSLVLAVLSETLQSTAQRAREAGQLQIAERVLFSLQRLHQGPGKAAFMSTSREWTWQLEYCRLFWARNEHRTALQMLCQLTDQLDKRQGASESAAILYPQMLCQYGQWLADTHNASPTTIMSDYMEKAVNLMSCICEKAPQAAMEAFFAVARFADKQHTLLVQQMSSTEEEDKEESIKKQVAELDQLSTVNVRHESVREVKHYVRLLKLAKETDSKYLERFRVARNQFLISSLKNYIRCLQAGDAYDLRIFRLISLWFENLMEKDVDVLMAAELPRLQSRKLLPLLYQLAARISCTPLEGTQFQQTVAKILEKLCLDHPHHSMYVILALRNANEGTMKSSDAAAPPPAKRMRRQTSGQSSSSSGDGFNDDKVVAARTIVQRLSKEQPALVESMCRLCEAYNELAYFNVQHLKGKTAHAHDIPPSFKLLKMKQMSLVAVTASNIEVDPSCEYKNLITIEQFQSTFNLVGGINMPKRIACLGSDGVQRQLLVKGQDDLRQDAVMQQVFEMVNQWLKRDSTTKKRQLRIRTYKVVPLSQRSGIVQWCVDTMPLGQYLVVGEQSAHKRYQPTAPSNMRCRETLTNAKTPENKLKAFMEVTKAFLPVFRYFFLENFPDPAQWFEHSLIYTRSAATASIVGYIMGLGDRHCQNILIDRRTAEVIHIDLGVAFEQGKALPTPETIPFRLTRDIVDGMGLSGTEGVFRRCCEATLQLMKISREELLTIVQVLLYDPLYQWTVSPVKARKLQGDGGGGGGGLATPQGTQTSGGGRTSGSSTGGAQSMESSSSRKMAEHVLKRMHQKLQGIEEEGVALSVSGQVAHLIQEATNESNLCRVFPGWQPWV